MAEATATPTATDFLQKKKTRVRLLTPSGVIEGDHAHPPGVRLSDSLRNASSGERYLLLTEVSIRGLDGADAHATFASAPFVLVNAAHASVIIPLEEHIE